MKFCELSNLFVSQAFVLTNDEIPPEFIISPAIPSTEFSHESDPEVRQIS